MDCFVVKILCEFGLYEYATLDMFYTYNIFERILTPLLFCFCGVLYVVVLITKRRNSGCKLEDGIEAFFVYLTFSIILVFGCSNL